MRQQNVLIFESAHALYQTATAYVARIAEKAIAERGQFILVLAGGGTPLPLYRRLANAPYRDKIRWHDTHIFWGDERMVPPTDEDSNYGQAMEALLNHVPVPPEQIYPVPSESDPASAARAYARTLAEVAPSGRAWPRFDLVLLGMGADGHTASLFPGSAYPLPERPATLAVWADYEKRPAARVTLTPPVFNDARHVFFLVTGEEKAPALATALAETGEAVSLPARRIWPSDGYLTWFVDQAAASLLSLS